MEHDPDTGRGVRWGTGSTGQAAVRMERLRGQEPTKAEVQAAGALGWWPGQGLGDLCS